MKIRPSSLLALSVLATAFVWAFYPLIEVWLDAREYRGNRSRMVMATGSLQGDFVALGSPESINLSFAVVSFCRKEQAKELRARTGYRGKLVAFIPLTEEVRDGDRLEISWASLAGTDLGSRITVMTARGIDPPHHDAKAVHPLALESRRE